jgi:predicted nucleic acid-binding protein
MYLDSCIFVKLLTPEPDSVEFSQYCAGQVLHTSELALTEVFAALLAKERAGRITRSLRERAWERFQSWVARGTIILVPLNRTALSKATSVLAQCHSKIPLRTLDAIHVGAVDFCQSFPLVTTDDRMRDAARNFGFALYPADPAHN